MIKNIWSQIWQIQWHISNLISPKVIFAGKPVKVPSVKYIYFNLVNNTEAFSSDVSWQTRTLVKRALFDFYIFWSDKNTPDQEVYEDLDFLSNSIVTTASVPLIDFLIMSISEGAQSWILRDVNERPYIIAQYFITYKNYYV